MYKGKRIIGIIPARGGSKGLPGKNIKLLLGRPLISWTIKQALSSRYLDRVIVTTDDKKIAAVARHYGAEVPFMRPKILARDSSPVSEAIIHALGFFEKRNDKYDIVVLLECTSPMRYQHDIDNMIKEIVNNKGAGSIIGLAAATNDHPSWAFKIAKKGYIEKFILGPSSRKCLNRQSLARAFFPYSIYVAWRRTFVKYKSFYQPRALPYFLKREQKADVDDELDFYLTECILRKCLTAGRL